jgi:hypothetical protein
VQEGRENSWLGLLGSVAADAALQRLVGRAGSSDGFPPGTRAMGSASGPV